MLSLLNFLCVELLPIRLEEGCGLRDSPDLVMSLLTKKAGGVLDALSFRHSGLAECFLAVPTQPSQEVNFHYWQHQMFMSQLPGFWNPEIRLKWRRLKITICKILCRLTCVVKFFFRSSFFKHLWDFYPPVGDYSEDWRHRGSWNEFVKIWKTGSNDDCGMHRLKKCCLPKQGKEAIQCDLEKWSDDKPFASVANKSQAPSAHLI